MHPFISIASTTRTQGLIRTPKINAIYIVGTKAVAGTMLDNSIREVPTQTEFNALVGAASGAYAAYRFIRTIDQSVPIFFVNGLATGGTPTLLQHLQAGLILIGQNLRLRPGIIVCPQSGSLALADQTALFNAAQNLVSNPLLNWQYFHNSALATQDKAALLTERATYSSPQGHSALFFGYGRDADNNQIPLASVAAARMTSINRNRRGYYSPSAFQESINFASVDTVYLPKYQIGVNEYEELNAAQINTMYVDGDFGTFRYTICGTRTLATDVVNRHINSRYAMNDLYARCSNVLQPFLFLPSDAPSLVGEVPDSTSPEAYVNADVISTLSSLLLDCDRENAFANPPEQPDGSTPEKYSIRPYKLATGDLGIDIEVWIVQSREKISMNFIRRG